MSGTDSEGLFLFWAGELCDPFISGKLQLFPYRGLVLGWRLFLTACLCPKCRHHSWASCNSGVFQDLYKLRTDICHLPKTMFKITLPGLSSDLLRFHLTWMFLLAFLFPLGLPSSFHNFSSHNLPTSFSAAFCPELSYSLRKQFCRLWSQFKEALKHVLNITELFLQLNHEIY